ncbi:MAG TPA: hypothetical protein PL109_01355 [Nitrospira sp.]|mgnify:CR=1 FL=1|nr:hypothetical protein [Nitrospira sp.]
MTERLWALAGLVTEPLYRRTHWRWARALEDAVYRRHIEAAMRRGAEDAGHHDVTEAIHEALDAAMAVLRKFEATRRYIAQREDGLR